MKHALIVIYVKIRYSKALTY